MKKGLMLILAVAMTFAGSAAYADDASTQKLLDKISSLESKVSRLEGKAAMPATSPTPVSGGSYVNNSDGINLGGYVSSGYNVNWLSPNPNGDSAVPTAGTVDINGNNTNVRAFDRDSNTFLENGKIVLEKAATEAGTAGFRADLMFGRDAQILGGSTIGDATNNFFVE